MTGAVNLTCDEVRDLAPLFVTGALDPDEMAAVREHLAGCDDAHAELAELGESAAALLETAPPAEPSASLKPRLLAAAQADLDAGRHPSQAGAAPAAAATPPAAAPSAASAAPAAPGASTVVSLEAARSRRGTRLGWVLAAAAVIVAVALGGWNIALRRDLSSAEAYRNGVDQALDLAAQPGSVTALLANPDGSVSGFGVVGADGTVKLAVRGLPATTGSQVYTAWSIEGTTPPVSMGDFTVGADGVAITTVQAPNTEPGATIALTLEPNAGNQAPAGPVVAAGVTRTPAG
jgi:anti-sigma factor RsiW